MRGICPDCGHACNKQAIRCGACAYERQVARGAVQRQRNWEASLIPGDPEACWEWTGTHFRNGYGRFGSQLAHRISWEKENGSVPEGLLVLHRCDNRACCNPAHLYAGTQSDNMYDRAERTAGWRGAGINTNKLSEEQVREIRARRDRGEILRTIAADFGISLGMASRIGRRESWRWLPEA